MSASFDCRCTWKLAGADPELAHAATEEAGAFVDQRPDVALSLFSRAGNRETLELNLEADDEQAAHAVVAEIASRIEASLRAEEGAAALTGRAIRVEQANGVGQNGEAAELLNPAFMSGLLSTNGTARHHADLAPIADPYGRMREVETSGEAHDLDTEAIVARIEDWESDHDFCIVDVGPSHVTLRFDALPDDLHEFAEQAFAFCPDLACDYDVHDEDAEDDQSLERAAVDAIAQGLAEDRVLRLWWD